MATLFIAVFEHAVEVAMGQPLQEITVSIGVASTQSVPIVGSDRKRRRVRMVADVACFATWGTNPTAKTDGTDGRPLAAEAAEYWDIESEHKIAVIERT